MAQQGEALVFVRRKARLALPPSAGATSIVVVGGSNVAASLWMLALFIDGDDFAAELVGRVGADALVLASWYHLLASAWVTAIGTVAAWRGSRHVRGRLVLTSEGVEAGAGKNVLRAPWSDVVRVEWLPLGRRSFLRTRGFSVALHGMTREDSADEGSGAASAAAVAQEVAAFAGVTLKRRWLTGTDLAIVAAVLPLLVVPAARLARKPLEPTYRRALESPDRKPTVRLAHLSAWLDVVPHDGLARGRRAGALAELGRFDEAMADAERAVTDEPGCIEAWQHRRAVADRMGDAGKAVAIWMQVMPGDVLDEPSFPLLAAPSNRWRWQRDVGRRLFLAGDLSRARAWFDASGHAARGTPDADFATTQAVALRALCDVAEGRPHVALAGLPTGDAAGSILPNLVAAAAWRCLDQEDELARSLAAAAAEPLRSRGLVAQRERLIAHLRGEEAELPAHLMGPGDESLLVALDAPLLARALASCEACRTSQP